MKNHPSPRPRAVLAPSLHRAHPPAVAASPAAVAFPSRPTAWRRLALFLLLAVCGAGLLAGCGGGPTAAETGAHAIPPGLLAEVRAQAEELARAKASGYLSENELGYLKADIPLTGVSEQTHRMKDIAASENVLRQKIFTLIAQQTGLSQEEVGRAFARMARP